MPRTVYARLSGHVGLEARAKGQIDACFGGYSVSLGAYSAAAVKRAHDLRTGLPLAAIASDRGKNGKEIGLLVRRLAGHGLLEYVGRHSRNSPDQFVIEPQLADYWPRASQVKEADVLVLSRFAYMRRRGNDMVLESPRSGALFRIYDPEIAAAIAILSTPQQIRQFRRQKDFPGTELLGLLVECQILFKVSAHNSGLRNAEGDDSLVLWDFHDLLFHARSTEGRQANPLGGLYPHEGIIPQLPAVRRGWPGRKIDLHKLSAVPAETAGPVAKLLHERHSTRDFDDQKPITLAELSRFLDGAARVLSRGQSASEGAGPVTEFAARPYPSAGGAYELELYLAVGQCKGLAWGFYHYDAGDHALVPIDADKRQFEALLAGAEFAMGASAPPQILITIAARFGRISWKYSAIAYSLILKDVGVLFQTFYLMAADLALGGCAIGIADIDLFAKMTGIEFHVEGPVGQFAIGRGAKSPSLPPA